MRNARAAALAAVTLGSLCGPVPARAQQLDTVNLIGCAVEGGVCKMPYPTNVYSGVPGKTNGRPFPKGGVIACNSQTFGDPAPNQAKSCWYAPRLAERRGADRGRDDDLADRRRDDDRGRRDDYRGARDDYRGGRDADRGGRDYDRPPPRRPYDDGYASERHRYRGDPDDE